jgi:hypothetical protein
MKSRGENLEEAYKQATGYLPGLKDASRVAFLFGLYEQMSSALAVQNVQRSKRSSTKVSNV